MDELILPEVPKHINIAPKTNGNTSKNNDNNSNSKSNSNDAKKEVNDSLNKKSGPRSASISVTELYELFKQEKAHPQSILLIDIRPPEEFLSSRINYDHCINVSPTLLKYGANLNSVERKLSRDTWQVWSKRSSRKFLVIVDGEFSRLEPSNDVLSHPVVILEEILCKTAEAEQTIFVVDGGFMDWIVHYPAMTTNPSYKKPVCVCNLHQEFFTLCITIGIISTVFIKHIFKCSEMK